MEAGVVKDRAPHTLYPGGCKSPGRAGWRQSLAKDLWLI